VPDTDADDVCVEERDRVGVTVPVGLRVAETLGERVTVPLLLTERVRLGDVVADQENDARADALMLRDGEPEPEGDRDRDGDAVVVLLTERLRLGDVVADQEKEARAEADLETVCETLAVADRDRDGLPVLVGLTEGERDCDDVTVLDPLAV
jgi:hypothetical protein